MYSCTLTAHTYFMRPGSYKIVTFWRKKIQSLNDLPHQDLHQRHLIRWSSWITTRVRWWFWPRFVFMKTFRILPRQRWGKNKQLPVDHVENLSMFVRQPAGGARGHFKWLRVYQVLWRTTMRRWEQWHSATMWMYHLRNKVTSKKVQTFITSGWAMQNKIQNVTLKKELKVNSKLAQS